MSWPAVSVRQWIGNDQSLAFTGSASARNGQSCIDAYAEALSITRLEGSRWRGGRLWSYKPRSRTAERLVRVDVAGTSRHQNRVSPGSREGVVVAHLPEGRAETEEWLGVRGHA
jgi:hypothetical protein